jgi:peptidoglycan hydrolase-like protein with peptidoglycan-binding domain
MKEIHVLVRRKSATILAAVALAAGLGLTAGGTATAAPARPSATVSASEVHVESWSCGYYSGTANTVYGNTGNAVREIQCLLVYVYGYDLGATGPDGDGVDGDFGSKTLAAVRAFQTWERGRSACTIKLSVDGQVGPHTWSALRADNGCATV